MPDYKNISKSRVEFQIEISEDLIKKSHKNAIDAFRKNVSVKGFRKGHAPDEVVLESVGLERISYEAMNRAIDTEYRNFLIANKLSPVSAPNIEVKDWEKRPLQVKCTVEVYPEVVLGDFQKIKTTPIKVEVTDKEIEEVILTIMSDAKLGKKVDRAAKKGDIVEIDFLGRDKDQKVLPRTEGKNQRVRLGVGHFLEDLEAGIVGMKAGEEKKGIKVKFPKTYHAPDIAGKTVPFEVKVHVVEEINAKDFTDAMVIQVTGQKKPVDQFKKDLKEMIVGNKTQTEKKKVIEEYQEKLVKMTKCELPESWIQGEVEARMRRIKESPQFQHDPESFWKQVGKSEEALRKEFVVAAEKSLKSYLALVEAVRKSNIQLTEIEKKEALKEADMIDKEGVSQEQALEKSVLTRKIDKFLEQAVS